MKTITLAVYGILLTARAGAADLTLLADAQVNSTLSGTNFGALPQAQVSQTTTAFLRFRATELGNALPGDIVTARLRVFINKVNSPVTMQVGCTIADWDENVLTAANAPQARIVGSVLGDRANAFVTFDVTSCFAANPGGFANTFTLSTFDTGAVFLDTKENSTTSQAAKLEVVLAGPQGPAGPQGVPGPSGAPGATGPQGSAGPAGGQGAAGPTGPQGTPGAQGAIGPQGAQGASGAQGPPGVNGISGIERICANGTVPSAFSPLLNHTAACTAGKRALGGSCQNITTGSSSSGSALGTNSFRCNYSTSGLNEAVQTCVVCANAN